MTMHAPKSDRDKRIITYLEFGNQMVRRLDAGNLNASTMQELGSHLKLTCPHPSPPVAVNFDRLGTQLWNVAIRLKDQSSPMFKTWPMLESYVRALAFFHLDLAQKGHVKNSSHTSTQNVVRVVKTGLKAARVCIDAGSLDLCTSLFMSIAEYVEHRQDPPPEYKRAQHENEAMDMLKELSADYYLLRGTLVWKQDKVTNVDFWLAKVILVPHKQGMLHLAERKADLMYEIGQAALQKKQYESAIQWLERSYAVFDDIEPDMLSADFCDLRLAVILDLVRALVKSKDPASLDKASHLVVVLDQEQGFRTEIFLLRLDIIFSQKPFQDDEFHGALVRIIRTAIMSEGTFRAVMYQIQKLNLADPTQEHATHQDSIAHTRPGPYSQLACQALDLLLSRLLAEDPVSQALIERVIVTRIWISSLTLQSHDHPDTLKPLFDNICITDIDRLSVEATHASQSLIWKAVTTLQQAHNESEAAKWCSLANHAVFASAGELNKAKLARKMITVALAQGNSTSAREAYYQMTESGKSAAVTKYLMYKIALREGDEALASESLDGVLTASTKGTNKYLYACALEAQHTGNRRYFIAAMNKVLEFYEKTPSSAVQLPVLLRCIAGSLTTELGSFDTPTYDGLSELCKVYEAVVRHGNKFQQIDSNQDPASAELQWFACNSYNTGLKHCSVMHPELLLRFMMATIALIDLLQKAGEQEDHGLLNRLLLCRFLAASTLVVLARAEDNIERALQLYLDARRQIEAFHYKYKEATEYGNFQPDTLSDLAIKEFEMLKFDLEALMRLQHWNDLDKTLSMCLLPRHAERLESAADLILHIHTYVSRSGQDNNLQASKWYNARRSRRAELKVKLEIPNVMEKIINICWRKSKDIIRLSRWIRCLFQMTMTTFPYISLRCIDQASLIASKSRMDQIVEQYPREEIEWLATTSFNHAIDLHFAEDEEGARVWADKALGLAVVVGDGVGLHKSLQERWLRLRNMAKGD